MFVFCQLTQRAMPFTFTTTPFIFNHIQSGFLQTARDTWATSPYHFVSAEDMHMWEDDMCHHKRPSLGPSEQGQIMVSGTEIFNFGITKQEGFGIFCRKKIVKTFFAERENGSFQTKISSGRKSARFLAVFRWQPLVSCSFDVISWPFYGQLMASCTFEHRLPQFPLWFSVQVATLAQLDAQLRASQTDFWGMWGFGSRKTCGFDGRWWELMGGGLVYVFFFEISLKKVWVFFGGW